MPRPRTDSTEAFGSDSFLDVVCNVVGILILLVLVVGLRVRHLPPAEAGESQLSPPTGMTAEQTVIEDLAHVAREQQAALNDADARRQGLELQITAARQQAFSEQEKVRKLRDQLDQSQQWVAELQGEVRGKGQQLQSLLIDLQAARPRHSKVVKIENYPSPISQTVHGQEAHFQLQAGRIAHVPFKSLVDRFKADAKARVNRAPSSPRIEAEVGPVGNFSLHYALKQAGYGRFGLERFSFIPQSKTLGEGEDALATSSQFRQVLASYDPNSTTVTLWIYPDSFNEYRELRKEIYTLGYAIAARPLPFGQLISGSPDGSRSAAQ